MAKKMFNLICILLITALIAPAAFAQEAQPSGPPDDVLAEHVPGEVLIRFQPWINSTQAEQRLADLNLTVKNQVPALGVKLVKLPPGLSVEEALERFSRRPGIEYVEPNYVYQMTALQQEEITDQWALTKVRAPEAWPLVTSQSPILLADVDTGIDRYHPDLAANIWTNTDEIPGNGLDDDNNGFIDDTWGWDFANNDNDPFDDQLHGTAVTSVMAGVQDGSGVAGVCPWCQAMAVKVLTAQGTGTLDVVANGIIYAADNGARVINLSLAGAAGAQTLQDAIDHAWNLGALIPAGAGNDGANALMYPAGYDNAMAIASTGENDTHSCFSNYAQGYISVAAPGENMLIALPDASYGYGSGTSLSTPMVSGLAGLLLSQNPDLSNIQLQELIESTSIDLSPAGVDPAFGHGRIDAYRAVTNDTTWQEPLDGLFSTNITASGYAHARKLVRDGANKLHMIWHTQEENLYRIRYATSVDNGDSWQLQPDVYYSDYETYHSALAADSDYLYAAIPSRPGTDLPYQILFTRMDLDSGQWTAPQALMGGSYHAVRPDLFMDPTNGKLHLLASSFDDAPVLYYRSSSDQGQNWSTPVTQINPSQGTESAGANTRYATIHANGDNLYIASKTISQLYFFTYYYLHTVRSTDGGQTWFDQTHISSFLALTSSEYGLSLAGVGDRLYMGYEVGANMYFRRFDNGSWSDFQTLETGDANNIYKWPTITQADDGRAWLIFELNGEAFMRQYDGSTWAPRESLGTASYANFKLGTSGNRVEWISTQCNGSPFLLSYNYLSLGGNNSPQANDQSLTTDEDTSLPITLTGSDPEGDPLTFTVTNQPSHGSLSGNAPALSYQPDPDYYGPDSFTFVADDGNSSSSPATISIDVNPVNDQPLAKDDSVVTDEDTPVSITLTGSDPENDPLTFTVTSQPSHGSLSGNAPAMTYTPAGNYVGPDSFTFITNDGTENSSQATISIQVNSVNDQPIANEDSLTTDEDTSLPITLTGSDPEGGPLTFFVTSQPSHGTLSGSEPDLTYQPDSDYYGPDSFTFVADDGNSSSIPATISIQVNPVNDQPIANDDSVVTDEDAPASITLTGFDVEGTPLTFSVTSPPSNGTLSGSEPDLTYQPDPNYYGLDSFTFTASDGELDSLEGTVSIQVSPVNDPPFANGQNLATDEDTSLAITLTGGDADGESITYLLTGLPSHGSLTGTAPDLTYTPAGNYYGQDSFAFVTNDGTVNSSPATISIDVNPVNDQPVALNDTATVPQGGTLDEPAPGVLGNDSDVDGDLLTVNPTPVTAPANGSLTLNTDGSYSYTHDGTQTTSDSFVYEISDGHGGTDTATVAITVSAVNNPPTAMDDSYTTDEDTQLIVTEPGVLDNDSDPDNPSLEAVLVSDVSDGTLVLNANGSFTYTPNGNFNGSDSFTYKANDGVADSNPATVTIAVDAVNDAPTANSLNESTSEETMGTWTPDANDVDGDTLNCSIAAQPAAGGIAAVNGDCSSGTYTPTDNFYGTDTFTYQVCDVEFCASATVDYTIPSSSLHLGDLASGSVPAPRGRWNALVSVEVHDALHNPVPGATVAGTWSDGATGGSSCITDTNGLCEIAKNNLKSNVPSVTFSLDSVTHTTLTYKPAADHDPDGGGLATSFIIYQDGPPANQPPQASFTPDCTGQTCDFDASSSFDSDGIITSYEWDFGDMSTDTGVTTSHTFGTDGVYPVSLTVTDDDGDTGSTTQNVIVGSPGALEMHVGDLDDLSQVSRKDRWDAVVAIIVHTGVDSPLEGATVTGTWDNGRVMSCTTSQDGSCTITMSNLKILVDLISFTVTDVTAEGWTYISLDNHDVDGDSNGTAIDLERPPLP